MKGDDLKNENIVKKQQKILEKGETKSNKILKLLLIKSMENVKNNGEDN